MKKLAKKIISRIIFFLIFILLMCLTIDQYVNYKASFHICKASVCPQNAQAILVLGARVTPQKKPSPILADRLEKAKELYQLGVAPKILVSGDHGSIHYDEVGAMKSFLVEAGVPEGDVVMDHAGFSTYESVVRAQKIFGIEKVVIVTQKYHLSRAVYTAQALKIETYGVPARNRSYPQMTKYRIREILARVKDFAFVHVLKPQPTFLGEPIPLDSGEKKAHSSISFTR